MRKLWPLIFIAVAFFAYDRWYGGGWRGDARPRPHDVAAQAGGPVRDLQRQPGEGMDMQGAMQSGGVSSKAMMDTARGAH